MGLGEDLPGEDPQLRTANGQAITYYGDRKVKLKVAGTKGIAECVFHVCDVSRPILSIGRLNQVGHAITFGADGAYMKTKSSQWVRILKHGNLHMLSVAIVGLAHRIEAAPQSYGRTVAPVEGDVRAYDERMVDDKID